EEQLEHREKTEIGATPGPRYYYSGPTVSGEEDVRSLDSAREIAALYDLFDVALIKEYIQPTRRKRQNLAQAAQESHVGITGHVGGLKDMLTRVADGFTAFEHSPFVSPVYSDVTRFLALTGVHFTPTIIVAGGIDGGSQGMTYYLRELVHNQPRE